MAHNHADMSGMGETGGGMMGGMMKPWLHFTLGDNLYFEAWVPMSPGAVVGACIGLFMLAIIDRWLAAMRGAMEAYWARRVQELAAARSRPLLQDESYASKEKRLSVDSDIESLHTPPTPPSKETTIAKLRKSAPFIPAHDFARGAMYACQSALGYALMLVVMTFHAGYIIAIILGLGVGEVLFGRFGALNHQH